MSKNELKNSFYKIVEYENISHKCIFITVIYKLT